MKRRIVVEIDEARKRKGIAKSRTFGERMQRYQGAGMTTMESLFRAICAAEKEAKG